MLKEFTKKIAKNILLLIIAMLCVVLCGSIYYLYRKNSPSEQIVRNTPLPQQPVSEDVTEQAETIKVYITGAINRPGVYELPKDSRVIELLELAEGASAGADLERVNLAAKLSDTQHVIIPTVGESLSEAVGDSGSGLININKADKDALMTLPGIGDVIASSIIEYRENNGGFETIDDLKNVSRIGEKTFDKLKDSICVE